MELLRGMYALAARIYTQDVYSTIGALSQDMNLDWQNRSVQLFLRSWVRRRVTVL